jgi:uncharacterized protein (TIGR03083 family)
MQQAVPIPTLHLFAKLDELLISLLRSLTSYDWEKPTLARLWNVKDVAAHLLDGNVRAIAALHQYEPPVNTQINSYRDLVDFLNQLNAGWVNAMKRVSPALLIHQLENTGKQYTEYLHSLQPFEQAKYSVAWAGEEQSSNWFHIAREYTEKWHHQQQIREAVGQQDALMTKELFYPCIATFMQALPHAYRNINADEGSIISFTISGDAGGTWLLQKGSNSWQFADHSTHTQPLSSVTLPPDVAWKLFTKAITSQAAKDSSSITGDPELSAGIFSMITVMA